MKTFFRWLGGVGIGIVSLFFVAITYLAGRGATIAFSVYRDDVSNASDRYLKQDIPGHLNGDLTGIVLSWLGTFLLAVVAIGLMALAIALVRGKLEDK